MARMHTGTRLRKCAAIDGFVLHMSTCARLHGHQVWQLQHLEPWDWAVCGASIGLRTSVGATLQRPEDPCEQTAHLGPDSVAAVLKSAIMLLHTDRQQSQIAESIASALEAQDITSVRVFCCLSEGAHARRYTCTCVCKWEAAASIVKHWCGCLHSDQHINVYA